jgi:hypothetical protein
LKNKRPSPVEVMAFFASSLAAGRLWLHHPVVVGRLMPTLIRTRDVAVRNMTL